MPLPRPVWCLNWLAVLAVLECIGLAVVLGLAWVSAAVAVPLLPLGCGCWDFAALVPLAAGCAGVLECVGVAVWSGLAWVSATIAVTGAAAAAWLWLLGLYCLVLLAAWSLGPVGMAAVITEAM